MQVLFWALLVTIVYVYFGYPALITLLATLRNPRPLPAVQELPSVSLVIAARNEENVIAQKLANTLELDYPRDKLEIIVASNGSADRTDEIVRGFADQGIRLLALEHPGKTLAQNAAVPLALGEIIVFTDADATLEPDALQHLARSFQNPTVGLAAGQCLYQEVDTTGIAKGESLYWKYENFIKLKEGQLGICTCGSGALMAIRKSLFSPLHPDMMEDFALPLLVAAKGHESHFVPEAIAEHTAAEGEKEQFARKARIVAQDSFGFVALLPKLVKSGRPLVLFAVTSHKLLRWLVPLFLMALIVVNLSLVGAAMYRWLLGAQLAFYALALVGYGLDKLGKKVYILYVPFYFCLVNTAALLGIVEMVSGKRRPSWHSAGRMG